MPIAGLAAMESVTAVCRACSPRMFITCESTREAQSQQVDPNAAAKSASTAATIFPSSPTYFEARASPPGRADCAFRTVSVFE